METGFVNKSYTLVHSRNKSPNEQFKFLESEKLDSIEQEDLSSELEYRSILDLLLRNPCLGQVDFGVYRSRDDDINSVETKHSKKLKEEIKKRLNYLTLKFKNLHDSQRSGVNVTYFQTMSEIFIKLLPKLKDSYSKIDRILYKNDTLQVDEPKKKHLIDTDKLLVNIDIHDISYAYNCMVNVKNTVNQCFDIAFLKLVEYKGNTWRWHLDWLILNLLNSKNMYKICIGLKIFKTVLKVDEFEHDVSPDFCSVVSDLSKIPEVVNIDENKMTRFVARHAKECHDFIEKNGKLVVYMVHDIFIEIVDGDVIRQCQIRALYEILKSNGSSSELYLDLCAHGLRCIILNIVHTFLGYLRHFDKMYRELDEEMRQMDKHDGQGFGGFSLKIVANDGMKKKKKKKKKPLCASDGLEKSTLNKYFFYDDAMKTLSMLSFLYNCFEKYGKDKLRYFKVKSYVTQFVIKLIHQRDLNKKIDKPIWIMEKILNTCHFIVFGQYEEKEKDIFLKLMNGEEIDEEDLICLKDFMMKNELSYKDEKCDYEYNRNA